MVALADQKLNVETSPCDASEDPSPYPSLERALSDAEQELQRDLSFFETSAADNVDDDDDDCSITSEVDNLHSLQETIHKELHELECFWRFWRGEGTKTKRPTVGNESNKFPASNLENTLLSLLTRTGGYGIINLALASDILAAQSLDSHQHSPILLPWLRDQLKTALPSPLNGQWLLSVPLLGSVAAFREGNKKLPERDMVGGGIQEIDEDYLI